jgi:hypothetical protein
MPALEDFSVSSVAISFVQLLQSSDAVFKSTDYVSLCQLQGIHHIFC